MIDVISLEIPIPITMTITVAIIKARNNESIVRERVKKKEFICFSINWVEHSNNREGSSVGVANVL